MRACAVALVIGCSAPAPKPVPAPKPPPPPAVSGGRVELASWRIAYLMQLGFVDGGRRLIAGNAGALAEIEPAARKLVATAALSSRTIPDPNGRPGVGETLAWNVDAAIWTWDPNAGSVIGAVSLSALGAATAGLAIWTPATGEPTPIAAPDGITLCQPLAWSADRSRLVVRVTPKPRAPCDADAQSIQVFAIPGGDAVTRAIDVGYANVAAFSSDGRYVAAGSDGLRVYDLREHAVVERIRALGVRSVAFHPTKPLLAWTDDATTVHGWRLGDHKKPHVEIGKGRAIAFSPDGRYLAVASELGVTLLDAGSFTPIGEPLRELHATPNLVYVAWSDDSRQLAVALSGTDIAVWRIGDAAPPAADSTWFAQLKALPIPPPRPPPRIEHDGEIDGVVMSGGKPVRNAEVTLRPHWQEYADARALPPLSVRTGPDGRFRVADAPTIDWVASVDAPGFVLGGSILDLRESKSQRTTYELDPAATIVGAIAGGRNVRITHYHYDGELDIDVAAKPDGRFVIDHIRPEAGKYELVARSADGAVRSAVVDVATPGPKKLALALLRADDPHVLRVVVVDAAGAPIANATVIVNESHEVPTDGQGRASLDVTELKGNPVRVMSKTGASGIAYVDLPQAKPLTIVVPAK